MKQYRNPHDVHPPVAFYSHQVEVSGPMRWLTLSGQIGQNADGTMPDAPIEQLDLAFENVARNLAAAQMTMGDVVKLTIYLVGDFEMQARRAIIVKHLGEHRPCVTMLVIAGLFDPKCRVEIDAWAACSEVDDIHGKTL
jgi:enamine deaminase RidA (YjgF/YER057c/UK114 family)